MTTCIRIKTDKQKINYITHVMKLICIEIIQNILIMLFFIAISQQPLENT